MAMMCKVSSKGAVLPTRPARAVSVRVVAAKAVPKKAGLLAALTMAVQAAPAMAADVPVDSAVDSVINAVKATGEVVKASIGAVESGVQVLKQGYDVAAPVVEQAYRAAAPVVGEAVKVAADAAAPVVKAALPAIQDAGKALETTGLTPKTVSEATSVVSKTATEAAVQVSPVVSKFLQVLATTDPVTLGEYAVGAAALVLLAPALLGSFAGSFRGFAGEVSAADALNQLVSDSSVVLVDIRTSKEKEGSGIPDLPSAASSKVLEVEYAVTEDKRLRGQLRDPSAIEAQVTALQIAALKKIGKGSKVLLIDRYGSSSKAVAKELARKGYGRVFVIAGGFDGRNGWVQSKLQIKPAATVISAAPPSITKTIFTRSKALPAPRS